MITTKVGKNHLIELKEKLYDDVYLNDNEPIIDNRLKLLNSKILTFKIDINNNADIKSLFYMTPYSHHTSIESKQRLDNIEKLNVTCEFNIDIYKNK